MRVMRRNLFYALASRRADVWEKRVRTKFSRKENFHVIKEFRHEKGKLFSPKQEAFWFTEGEILGGYILVDEN